MSKNICVIAVVLAAGSTAMADRVSFPADSLEAPPIARGGAERTGGGIFFEDFETGFSVGTTPQNGWTSQFNPSAHFTNIDPIDGMMSFRHTSDGSSFSGFEQISPIFTPSFGVLAADVRLTGSNSLYQFITVGDTGTFSTRVNFETDGRIRVGQVDMSGTMFEFIDSGSTWSVGNTFNFGIGVRQTGELDIYLDGAIIFSGLETNFVLSGNAAPIDQWLSFTNNVGSGTVGGTGDTMTVDNFGKVIPTPGALALFGLAGLGAVRRRR